jgi:hypothetical protein
VKRGVLVCFLLMLFSTLTFASEEGIFKLQGIIMKLNPKGNMMIVNERQFSWDQQTLFYSEKGYPITLDQFKEKSWVYIEGEKDKLNKRIVIKKIYLLPKYVDNKEKHLYPFME